jgi:hypothetical protein
MSKSEYNYNGLLYALGKRRTLTATQGSMHLTEVRGCMKTVRNASWLQCDLVRVHESNPPGCVSLPYVSTPQASGSLALWRVFGGPLILAPRQ